MARGGNGGQWNRVSDVAACNLRRLELRIEQSETSRTDCTGTK